MIGSVSSMQSSYAGMMSGRTEAKGALAQMREAQEQSRKAAEKLASGKKINRAADNPAGLAVAMKLLSQADGYETASGNIQDMSNALNTAEGAYSSIQSSIGRMQELATQAANGTYTAEDRAVIQGEIDQIKGSISQTASSTNFNGISLIDGSFRNVNTASTPDGKGMQANLGSGTLDALGLQNLDVTGNYSTDSIASTLKALQSASDKVSSMRGEAGAQVNALEHAYNNNTQAAINQLDAESRIADTDMAKSMMDYQKNMMLQQVGMFALQQKMQGASFASMAG